LQAQTVSWTTGYPNLNPSILTALDDPGYLDIYFIPTIANITNAKLEVTLPAGITYAGLETGTGHKASITYNTPSFSSQIVTVTFNSNGNTLKIGEAVFLRLKVSAACSAVNGMDATIKVLSGSTVVTSGQKKVSIGVQKPTIRVQCAAPTQNYADQNTPKEFELSLDAQNGEAASFLLVLTGDQYAVLSDFSLDGTPITPVSSNVVSGTTGKTTLRLTTTEMNGKLGTTVKKLKFKALNSRCGARNITTSTQYPATSSCITQNGVTLTMSFPAISGVPDIKFLSANWLGQDEITPTDMYGISTNGTTPTYVRMTYKNDSSVDAYDLKVPISFYGNFYYFDTGNVHYSINGEAKKKVDPGVISITSRLANNSSIVYYKPEHIGKPRGIQLNIPEVLKSGQEITVWAACIGGNIHDNGTNNLFYDYWTSTFAGMVSNPSANNMCGVAGSANSAALRLVYERVPHIREFPADISFRPGEQKTQRIRISAEDLSVANKKSVEVFVQLPSWLGLDGNIENAIVWKNLSETSSYAPVAGSGVDHGGGKYSIKFTGISDSNGFLYVKYKAGACPGNSQNYNENIHYWLDWHTGDGTDPLRPVLKCVSQIFQPAHLFCLEDGMNLSDFHLVRTTRGLKDSGNDGIPDDGSTALGNEIINNYYMQKDEGYLEWKGSIAGLASTTYKYWYAPVTLTSLTVGASGNLIPNLSNAYIKINGVQKDVQITYVSGKGFYLYCDASSNPMKGGDPIEVQLPFKVNSVVNSANSALSSACFVSNTQISNPFVLTSADELNRHGQNIIAAQIGTFSLDVAVAWTDDAAYTNFTNNNLRNANYGYVNDIFHSTQLSSPYFKNEVRRHAYISRIVWEMPDGYILPSALTLENTQLNGSSTKTLSAASQNGNTYTYDVSSLFDLAYDGSNNLTTGKWMLPDDRFNMVIKTDIQATKGAPLGRSTTKRTLYYTNPATGIETGYAKTAILNYSSLATTLSLSTSTLPAYSSKLSIPVVTVGNPNAIDLNNVWLYIAGNVKDISITPTGGGNSVSGEGFEGRWIKVSDLMAPGSTLSYKLDFTYDGSNDCSVTDKVKIYTVSGFENPWTAPTSAALNLTDYDHVGASKELSITAAPAAISGSVSISTPTLTFNTPYTVTAGLNALSSQGALKDPQMEIVIPKGQKYVAGSAKIEYPLGATPVPVSSALESALQAINANLGSPNTVILNAGSFLLPGYLAAGNDNDRQIKITAEFSPQCETELTGIRYTGVLSGKTACGGVAQGSGVIVSSSQLFSNTTQNYIFQVRSALLGGNNTFNEKRTTATFRVTINKTSGLNDNMTANDSLQLILPKQFDVSGSANISSGLGAGTPINLSANTAGNERQIKLSLPVSAYNAATDKGVGVDVVYDIPVVYTPSGQDLASTPEQEFISSVISDAQFGASCAKAPASIGSTKLNIAVLTADSNTANACLNTAKELKITSNGFGGSWYEKSDRTGAVLSSAATYNYIPVLQRDTIFHVSAVVNGNDYGTVPVEVAMHPEATIAVTAPAVQCSASSSVDLTATVSNTPSLSTMKYYSNNSGVNELSNTTVTPTVTTIYYAQVTTGEGCKSMITPVKVTVTPTPSMTAPTNLTVCPGTTSAINLAGLGTNTTHFTWSGGASIGLRDENGTPPKIHIPSFTAVNTSNSPVVVTITVTPQNTANGVICSGTSRTFTITVNPTPVAGVFSNTKVCSGIVQPEITPTSGTAVAYYTWSGGNSVGLSDHSGTGKTAIPSFPAKNFTSETIVPVTVIPYYVNNAVTCKGASATFTVTVHPLPVIQLTTDKTNDEVCINKDITLTTASGMTNYIWNKGGATTTTSGGGTTDNTATLQWNTVGTNSVSVNYTDVNGCTATAAFSKTVKVLPVTAITTQPAVAPAIKLSNECIIPGSNVKLSVSATGHNLSYQWYWKKATDNTIVALSDGGKYSGTTAATFTIGNAYETENGDYYVTVTGTCGNNTSDPVTLVAVANQDASLKDLKINGVTLSDFNAAKVNYIRLSTCEEDRVTIACTPNNSKITSITGNGTFSLNPGDNYLNITVIAQDMVTTMTYTVNVIRDCYVPKITKDLEDAIICINDSHTFEIGVEGKGVTYEWYYGNSRILGANTNRYTITHAQLNDYEKYYVIVRSNYNGYRASTYSKQVRLWVSEQLPETLRFATYPDPAITGKTYHLKLAGYSDVTQYRWSYVGAILAVAQNSNDGVTFSPETGTVGENETWATFGTLSEGTGTLTATLNHPCGTRVVSRTIRVTYPTGAENVTADQITIYPNPTTGVIRISNTIPNQVIKITDVAGSLKGAYKTQEGATTIDLTGYAKGAYMVQYSGKTYKVIRK
jgi:hypothetical protein